MKRNKFIPYQKKPCKNCPFRKDCLAGWLGSVRIVEILESDSFVCHKTTGGEKTLLQCAGFMIIKGFNSSFVRVAYVKGISLELTGSEIVFDSSEDCVKHHSNS